MIRLWDRKLETRSKAELIWLRPFGTGNQTFGLNPQSVSSTVGIAALYGDLCFQHARRYLLEQMNAKGYDQTWTYLYNGQRSSDAAQGGQSMSLICASVSLADIRMLVTHTSDLAYFFGEVSDTINGPGGVELSKVMLQYW